MSEPMLCPNDRTPLVMSERQNIEIDYCPTCRGVWLDRGELDKIIERSAALAPPASVPQQQPPQQQHQQQQQSHYRDDRDRQHYKKRKKSFLEEIFD